LTAGSVVSTVRGMRRRRVAALALVVLVAGCSTKKTPIPAEKLWSEADQAFSDEAWELSVDRYKAVLDQYPFDARAEEAELRIAQSYYLSRRYPEAISAFGDFERMHPTSPSLAQVEYQLGMAYLLQATTSDRDQQAHSNALTYFRNVVDRFPRSPWAERARLRMRECRESLAQHEYGVARYYLRQGNLLAAESRLRSLLVDYPDSDATAQALYMFAGSYASRDEQDGATLALATLARHHADGPLGREAHDRLGPEARTDGQDPLSLLLSHLDRMRAEDTRTKVPPNVSAYPDIGGANAGY
jgi:outer membrane protein assembly factor BamD